MKKLAIALSVCLAALTLTSCDDEDCDDETYGGGHYNNCSPIEDQMDP